MPRRTASWSLGHQSTDKSLCSKLAFSWEPGAGSKSRLHLCLPPRPTSTVEGSVGRFTAAEERRANDHLFYKAKEIRGLKICNNPECRAPVNRDLNAAKNIAANMRHSGRVTRWRGVRDPRAAPPPRTALRPRRADTRSRTLNKNVDMYGDMHQNLKAHGTASARSDCIRHGSACVHPWGHRLCSGRAACSLR